MNIPISVTYIDPTAFGHYERLKIHGSSSSYAKAFAMEQKAQFIPVEEDIFYGDLNFDGEVSVTDITMARRYYQGDIDLSAEQVKRLDLNLDGKIDSRDLTILRRYYYGEIKELPII